MFLDSIPIDGSCLAWFKKKDEVLSKTINTY